MKKIPNIIKSTILCLAIIIVVGKILAFIYPASDPNSKECPGIFIMLLLLFAPLISGWVFPSKIKNKAIWFLAMICKGTWVVLWSVGILIEWIDFLLKGNNAIISLLLLIIFSAVLIYIAQKKKRSRQRRPNPGILPAPESYQSGTNSGTRNHKIYICRKQQLQSAAKPYTVIFDGAPAGILYNGKSILIRTTTGQHKIDFKGYWKVENSTTLFISESNGTTNIFTKVSTETGKIVIENIQESAPSSRELESDTQFPHRYSLARVDAMEGHEFEHFTAGLLRKLGYQRVEVTRGSGDQGVDVLAEKDGIKYAFQCKCYSSDLGNKPVQEVHAGKYIYQCHVGVVITNRYFTQGAKDAAKATGILLWDRDKLREMMEAVAQ